jgi:uncharacterized C2H2 Zn-finger protein
MSALREFTAEASGKITHTNKRHCLCKNRGQNYGKQLDGRRHKKYINYHS